jgi:BirA family transcriptional regulator, biotin operon repressor / biotin---[acetyl-CoA-carboxylase] ligase
MIPSSARASPGASLGYPRVHFARTDSTNERARELAIAGAPPGTLVTAAEQSAGRGRQGRSWAAPGGSSLLMSLILRSPPRLLPLAAAVAVCDAVDELQSRHSGVAAGQPERPGLQADARAPSGLQAHRRTLIKWPNDIVLAAGVGEQPRAGAAPFAKLAGSLIEGRPREGWAVLGIGINVAVRLAELPAELQRAQVEASEAGDAVVRMPAATMGLERSAVEPLLARLLEGLQQRLAEGPAATLAAWRARDALRGRAITWNGGAGRAEGIDDDGRLIVALADGRREQLGAGEVHILSVS